MKEDDISRAFGTHGEKRIACRVLIINHGKKRQFEDQSVDGNSVLKSTLKTRSLWN
jgi:hypothetical protein